MIWCCGSAGWPSPDPMWTPSRGHRAQLRDPAVLAADPTGYRLALAAVHQAADALARMAAADLAAITTVGSANRFYMPETVLWSPHPSARDYSTAPRDRVMLLRDVYQVIVSTSRRATRALDDLALDSGAPSRIVALARKATPQRNQPQLTDPDLALEDLQPQLKFFGRIKNGRAAGQADLDAQAVIRAYTERQRGLIECAHRFSASEETIRAVLKEHGIPIRSGLLSGTEPRPPGQNPGALARSPSPPSTAPHVPQPLRGPVERTVRAMKVDHPRLRSALPPSTKQPPTSSHRPSSHQRNWPPKTRRASMRQQKLSRPQPSPQLRDTRDAPACRIALKLPLSSPQSGNTSLEGSGSESWSAGRQAAWPSCASGWQGQE
ncbi:MAG TPA: hypothetical protein VF070_21670 [Streptosporangiaceae bacterium]